MKIRKILVPLDGSVVAEQILPYAVNLAQLTQSEILLLEVAKTGETIVRNITGQPLRGGGAEKPLSYLASVSETITNPAYPLHLEKSKVKVNVVYDVPMQEIPNIAARENADLIMMTTHGRSGLFRLVLGSAAANIIHNSGLPIVILRSKESRPLPMLLSTERAENSRPVMITFDDNTQSELAIEPALAFANLTNAPVHLVHVIEYYTPGIYVEPVDVNKQWVKAKAYLTHVQEELEAFGLRCKTVILEGEVGEQITEYAKEVKAQLVAMATKAQGSANSPLLGSVALDVLQNSSEPILLVNINRYKSSYATQVREAKV